MNMAKPNPQQSAQNQAQHEQEFKALNFDLAKLLAFFQYLLNLFNQGQPGGQATLKAKKAGCDDQCECAHECLCHALQIAKHQIEILDECQVELPK
jgi:hypothetical protein